MRDTGGELVACSDISRTHIYSNNPFAKRAMRGSYASSCRKLAGMSYDTELYAEFRNNFRFVFSLKSLHLRKESTGMNTDLTLYIILFILPLCIGVVRQSTKLFEACL